MLFSVQILHKWHQRSMVPVKAACKEMQLSSTVWRCSFKDRQCINDGCVCALQFKRQGHHQDIEGQNGLNYKQAFVLSNFALALCITPLQH